MWKKSTKTSLVYTMLISVPLLLVACGDQYSNSYTGLPDDYSKIECYGDIESINSIPIHSMSSINSNQNVIISGWVAKNAKEGVIFDKVQVIIEHVNAEIQRYDTFKTKRDDVSNYYESSLDSSGFNAFIRRDELKGSIIISVMGYKGKEVFLCKNIHKELHNK